MAVNWLRYSLQRLDYLWQLSHKINAAAPSFSAALEKLGQEIDRSGPGLELTEAICLAGVNMCPALNARATKDKDAVEHLLMRRLPWPSPRNCAVGDVVVLDWPKKMPRDIQFVLVRRIAAMPGDQMLSDSAELEPFVIPLGHCWVLADNPAEVVTHSVDSRFFGLLPLENIRGRVIYNGYDKRDHGAVRNSPQATQSDDILLKFELDLDRLFSDAS